MPQQSTPASRPYLRLAVLACLAATAAYSLGLALPALSGIVAAITTLIAVRPTFHESVQEAWRQVLGTILGALVGAGLLAVFGWTAPVVLVALLAAFAAAWLLRLGEEGAITIAVTVILVIGAGMSTDAVESRVLGVVVGVLLAMLVSLYVRSGTPHDRALADTLEQADRLSALLAEIGARVGSRPEQGRISAEEARGWLDQADDITRVLDAARTEAEGAVAGSRWSPLVRRADAEQVLRQAIITQATATTVVGMCRSMLAGDDDTVAVPVVLAEPLAQVLTAAATAVAEQAEAAWDNPAEPLDAEPARDLADAQAAALARIRDADTAPLLLGGALVSHSDVLARILSGDPDQTLAEDSDSSETEQVGHA